LAFSRGRTKTSVAHAQWLARRLKACKRRPKKQRRKCESRARKRFGVHNMTKPGGLG
jgi:hypothetical protein